MKSFIMSDDEVAEFHKWNDDHIKICSLNDGPTPAIGGALTYSFTPTGLGLVVEISCACGEKINVTNYDLW